MDEISQQILAFFVGLGLFFLIAGMGVGGCNYLTEKGKILAHSTQVAQ